MVERGFSGGPVFGRSDTVIFGAITAKARDHWVAYAIPAEAIERALPAAKAEHKTGALDHAAPLARWDLPEQVGHLRRLLEARMDRHGRREFVQVLRLLEVFPEAVVAAAVTDSMRLGAISFDAVKQLALGPLERRPARLDLRAYPICPGRRCGPRPPATTRHCSARRRCNERDAASPLGHHLKTLVKSLASLDFRAIPSLNKMLVLELARSEYILRQDNVIALGDLCADEELWFQIM